MSRFYPRAEYAENQPLARTILTVHCLARGATTGAIVGTAIYGAKSLSARFRPLSTTVPASTSTPAHVALLPPSQRLLRAAGRGTVIGTAVLAAALGLRMRAREEIEWRDRSWRLLVNRGQVECDDWTLGGAVLGLVAGGGGVVVARGLAAGGRLMAVQQVVGAAGLGSVVGTIGYMGWRYGVKGGKWDSEGEGV